MERVVGAILGLAAFVAVVALGITRGIAFRDCLWRAFAAMVVGYLVGWLIFGPVGRTLVKEAAGPLPPPPPAEPKPAAPALRCPAPEAREGGPGPPGAPRG